MPAKGLLFNSLNFHLFPDLFIVNAKRTAFGAFGGTLKNHTATDLAEHASRAAITAASINPERVDHVIIGKSL
jgi:acetyl-CoA acyltransferase 2